MESSKQMELIRDNSDGLPNLKVQTKQTDQSVKAKKLILGKEDKVIQF